MKTWIMENHDLLEVFAWLVLAPVTLIWLKDSILWVALMSLYANAKTAHGAWKADQAKRAAENS